MPGPVRTPPAVTEELLRALPKTDLHCHLDGSLRLATVLELAQQHRIRLPAETPEGRIGLGYLRRAHWKCGAIVDAAGEPATVRRVIVEEPEL